ncbi:hypothetical protein [Clostridium sp. HBUAS56017]|uniref:hypothetical protein n=1 Tax=Clostridium sp. HBUAS56017 TaxID=2571128 RepID=UPI001FA94DC0|nr:hypothetical protein [Clostridium sp. HBUAS56017]
MNIYKLGTCGYCSEKNQILRPSPFLADRTAMMCEHCWNGTQKEYAASNGEYIPDFNNLKEEYEEIKKSIEKEEEWIVELTEDDYETWSSDIDCNSREEAIEKGMEAAKKQGLKSFRIGKKECCTVPTIWADTIIESAGEQLYDEVGEVSETYLDDVTEEQGKELEEELNEVFYNWHKKHNLFPTCYTVEKDETIEVK